MSPTRSSGGLRGRSALSGRFVSTGLAEPGARQAMEVETARARLAVVCATDELHRAAVAEVDRRADLLGPLEAVESVYADVVAGRVWVGSRW